MNAVEHKLNQKDMLDKNFDFLQACIQACKDDIFARIAQPVFHNKPIIFKDSSKAMLIRLHADSPPQPTLLDQHTFLLALRIAPHISPAAASIPYVSQTLEFRHSPCNKCDLPA